MLKTGIAAVVLELDTLQLKEKLYQALINQYIVHLLIFSFLQCFAWYFKGPVSHKSHVFEVLTVLLSCFLIKNTSPIERSAESCAPSSSPSQPCEKAVRLSQ